MARISGGSWERKSTVSIREVSWEAKKSCPPVAVWKWVATLASGDIRDGLFEGVGITDSRVLGSRHLLHNLLQIFRLLPQSQVFSTAVSGTATGILEPPERRRGRRCLAASRTHST